MKLELTSREVAQILIDHFEAKFPKTFDAVLFDTGSYHGSPLKSATLYKSDEKELTEE